MCGDATLPMKEGEFLCKEHFRGTAIWKGETTAMSLIKNFLSKQQLKMFRDSCFGSFANLNDFTISGSMIHCMLMCQVHSNTINTMRFSVRGQSHSFALQDFASVTGLKCCEKSLWFDLKNHRSQLISTYFNGVESLRGRDLKEFMSKKKVRNDEDALKLAQFYFVAYFLLGQRVDNCIDISLVNLIEDDKFCEAYPWGNLCFEETFRSLRYAQQDVIPRRDSSRYNFSGCALAFQTWALETISFLKCFALYVGPKTPRILSWENFRTPRYETLRNLFFPSKRAVEIQEAEENEIERSFTIKSGKKRCLTTDAGNSKVVKRAGASIDSRKTIKKGSNNPSWIRIVKRLESKFDSNQDMMKDVLADVIKKQDKILVFLGQIVRGLGGDEYVNMIDTVVADSYEKEILENSKEDGDGYRYENHEACDKNKQDNNDYGLNQAASVSWMKGNLNGYFYSDEDQNLDHVGNAARELIQEMLDGRINLDEFDWDKQGNTHELSSNKIEPITKFPMSYDDGIDPPSFDLGFDFPPTQAAPDPLENSVYVIPEGIIVKKPSYWLRSPFVDSSTQRKKMIWPRKCERRCIFHYDLHDELSAQFSKLLEDCKHGNCRMKHVFKFNVETVKSMQWFLELADQYYRLHDGHVDVSLYSLKKKSCYHLSHSIRSTVTDLVFDSTLVALYDKWEDNPDKFPWDQYEELTDLVYGKNRRCGISWEVVDIVFFPCRSFGHYFLGVFDLDKQRISVYDSLYGHGHKGIGRHILKYAKMIPSMLEHLNFKSANGSYSQRYMELEVEWKDCPKQMNLTDCGAFVIAFVEVLMFDESVDMVDPLTMDAFRWKCAMNLWSHGMWKASTGSTTPPEIVGHDYLNHANDLCAVELGEKLKEISWIEKS